MALQGFNTNSYSGEFQEHVLTLAATGNELVEKRLIHVIPQVLDSISIPRIKTSRMLQKRKEHPRFDPSNPENSDAKGDFTYSEQKLMPRDMMVYTAFLPKVFEHIWRPFQPKGNLVFQELPASIQSIMIAELLKQVQHEMGFQYINGKYEEGADDRLLMDGILTQAAKDADVVKVYTVAGTMLGRLKELREKIPVTMRHNLNLRILMSVEDFDTCDDELTALVTKGKDATEVNVRRYRGIRIEDLTDWPQGLIVATICSDGLESNLFAAVSLANDENVIRIEQMANGSEYYFFKMLMKGDTNIGFGEEFIAPDRREGGAFSVAEEESGRRSNGNQRCAGQRLAGSGSAEEKRKHQAVFRPDSNQLRETGPPYGRKNEVCNGRSGYNRYRMAPSTLTQVRGHAQIFTDSGHLIDIPACTPVACPTSKLSPDGVAKIHCELAPVQSAPGVAPCSISDIPEEG